MDKDQVIAALTEIGVLLVLNGESPFKTRAYENAARALETLTEPLEQLIANNRLDEVRGLGEGTRKKIEELVATGSLGYLEELKKTVPPGLLELLRLPGLGPKKVRSLHKELAIDSLDALEKACQQGRVAELSGFGKKTEEKILAGIAFHRLYASQFHLDDGLTATQPILDALRSHPAVIRCDIAGSLRRSKEVIGDLDFVVSSREPASVIELFTGMDSVLSVNAKGETKASVILSGGIQADLRVISDQEFPSALAYFTGSKEHNIVMRQRAIARGLRLNEYGLFESEEETRDPERRVECPTEEAIFDQLGLDYIPPELREDRGEFEAAEKHALPRLLEWTDLRGSLHNHSDWSDGHDALAAISEYVQELGCEYWAITDHSRSSFVAHGLDSARLRRQLAAVGEMNARLEDDQAGFQLLAGSEVDILAQGKLDFDDALLGQLDVVVASIHQGFSAEEAEMTKRLIRAAENPYVHMLGHLTGRLLLEREAYAVNQEAVIDACAETGTWIELNCNPYRFDLDWRLWPYATRKGVKCVINCDAHRLEHAMFLRPGVGVARKGWLRREDVVNTLRLDQLRGALQEKRRKLGVAD